MTLENQNEPTQSPKNKIIVITGTSKGIGRGLAEYFIEKNYTVVGCSRNLPIWEHPNYRHYQVDVSDEKMVQSWARQVRRDHQKVDVLVCNVGLVKSALQMAVTSVQAFEEFYKSNLLSTFLVCREFAKLMIMQKSGRIINISSIMSDLNEKGTGAYSATKGAVENMSKVLAKELAAQNITVNVLSPSMVITDSNRQLGEEWEKWMLDKQTLKRAVTTQELGHVIEFFAAPLSGAITGQVIQTCYAG